MKILVTGCCGELVVPFKEKDKPRTCGCGNSSVWWENPIAGILKVYSKVSTHNNILCVHNGIFNEVGMRSPDHYRNLAKLSEGTVFHDTESLLVLVPVGTTRDVDFASEETFKKLTDETLSTDN